MLAFKRATDPKKAEFEKDLRSCINSLKECKKAEYFFTYMLERGYPAALEVKIEADRKISEFYGKHNSDGQLISRVKDEMNNEGKSGRQLAVLSIFAGGYFLAKYISQEFSNFYVFFAAILLMKFSRPNEFLMQLVQKLQGIELEEEIEKVRNRPPEDVLAGLERFRAWLGS